EVTCPPDQTCDATTGKCGTTTTTTTTTTLPPPIRVPDDNCQVAGSFAKEACMGWASYLLVGCADYGSYFCDNQVGTPFPHRGDLYATGHIYGVFGVDNNYNMTLQRTLTVGDSLASEIDSGTVAGQEIWELWNFGALLTIQTPTALGLTYACVFDTQT